MPGSAETVVKYPTYYLKPDKSSRIVREVVYKELERLSELRKVPDVLSTGSSIYEMYSVYRRLGYSIPELLSAYQPVDKRCRERLSVESIPWETIPSDIIERCLDENMELAVTDELLDYMGFRRVNTIYDRYEYPSRLVDKDHRDELIVSPVYNKYGKLVGREYLVYDESIGDYRRALTRDISSYYTNKTIEEVEYVVEMFNKENERNRLGLRPSLLAKTIWSICDCLKEYRKQYFSVSYIDRLASKSVEELRKERVKDEREYAVSLRGKYCEDTSVLWRYGQLSD